MMGNIVKIKGAGNHLFHTAFIVPKIAQNQIDQKIVNELNFYEDFIERLSAEGYRELFSNYTKSIELTHISYLFTNYLFGVHYINGTKILD